MNKDFVTATPDSGSGGATVSVSASENQGGSRSASLNVGGSGVNKSVSVSQEEATITWEYVFSIDRSSGSVGATGGSVQVNITSYRKKIINGKDSGQTESVGVSISYHSGDDFTSVNRDGLPNYVVVSAGENTNSSSRTEVDRFTQDGSGYTADFSFSQEAATIEYKYEASIYPTLEYWNYDEFIEKGFRVTATQTKYVNGKPAGSEPANWSYRAGSYSDPSTNYFSARKDGNWLYVSLETQNDTGQEQYQVYDITSPSGVYIDASCRAVVYG